MKKQNRHFPAGISLLILAISFTSCWSTFTKEIEPQVEYLPVQPEAWVPVYGTDSVIRGIKKVAPKPTFQPGKIYVYGNLLFQVEQMKGVHVIDFTDREHPEKLGFITCQGSSELAVKDGYLVTNNLNDLVTIDFRDSTVKEVARIRGAFPHYNVAQYQAWSPPEKNAYYVCPDIYKGDVIGWKLEKNVSGAFCYNY